MIDLADARGDCRRWLRAFVCLALLAGCGDAPSGGAVAPVVSPERTAAQDRAVRALVMDVAEARACAELRGRFFPLPEERDARPRDVTPNVDGRLWIAECRVTREGDRLAIHVEGRGWQWIERTEPGPLGSSFTVRGQVRFEASLDLVTEVDVRYDERARRASIALTPHESARARVTPIGAIPVSADGSWSGVIGGLGSLLGGGTIEERARPLVEARAAEMVQGQLREGLTISLDLCTGQMDATLGAVGDGSPPPARPYPDDERELWLDNLRTQLRPGGLDLSGPWRTGGSRLFADIELEDGTRVDAVWVCRADAGRIASEHLAGGEAPAGLRAHRSAVRGRPITLSLEPSACDEAVLMVRPTDDVPARYRYRVRREGDVAEAWARCGR